jgi:EpsI family protein
MIAMTHPNVESRRRGRLAGAALSAVFILVACGIGYRVLADRYTSVTASVRLERGAMGALPIELGDWRGQDVPLDERIILATDTDDHLYRVYQRTGGNESLALFVAFGIRGRDLMPHRPEVCYPAAGMAMRGATDCRVETADQTPLDARILEFTGGTFGSSRITLLNYYIVDGENCPDVSLLRSRAWRFKGPIDYVVQVQIICARDMPSEAAQRSLREFASVLDPALRTLLSDLVSRSTGGDDQEIMSRS